MIRQKVQTRIFKNLRIIFENKGRFIYALLLAKETGQLFILSDKTTELIKTRSKFKLKNL